MNGDMHNGLRPLAPSLSKDEPGVFNSLADLAIAPLWSKNLRR
jgi:hypothetical protein